MKHFVERTCTVVRGDEEERGRETESSRRGEPGSRPLESFREVPAYVLLGPPGSGKTEAFRREAEREGERYVTARDFLTFDPEPDWEGGTIHIDGLDETRAGSFDGRTPFDGIRAKLQRMGSPPFRLSCREADWFGANDRERLAAMVPHRELHVLRLDPLSDQGILEILARNHAVADPAAFVAQAGKQGVEDLLLNPQNLRMLAEAVAEADEWPRTRTETFDMACRKLVSEENPEHGIACGGTFGTQALLDGAGDLCALLILAGNAGVTLPGTVENASHPALARFPSEETELLRRAVGTNLFAMPSEGRMAPAHRQIAEFLAAGRLAARIADGLPVMRVLSLMTGFDGGIISEFRGLAAWLAALSTEARPDIIDRDALGVVLYGDIGQFGPHGKRLLFRALKGEINENPWLVPYTSSESPLRLLVGPDLKDDMREALTDPARDDAHQSFVRLICEAIRDAAPRPGLADPLMAVVRDDSWRTDIRTAALEAYIRARRGDSGVSVTLRALLDDGVLAEQGRLQNGTPRTPQANPIHEDGRFDQLRSLVKDNESALRGNECRVDLLHTLAVAYFDGYSDVSGGTPKERLQCLLGPDNDLVAAALAGLRGAVHRPDLPEWTEVSKLAAEGRTHYLAYPFMAGLQELVAATETSDCGLGDPQTRLAVAIHFSVPRIRQRDHAKRPPGWFRDCLARDPVTVAEVWSRCARAQLGRGERYLPDTDRLAREPEYAQLAQAASVPLLKAFPVRCRSGQLPILSSLLEAAIAHGSRTQLLELIDTKLAFGSMNSGQRVHWLTAGSLVQPEAYDDRLESYVSGNPRRIQRLVEMAGGHAVAHALRGPDGGVTLLGKLIRLIGPYAVEPPSTGEVYSVTWPIQADRMLRSFIDRLAEDTSHAAGKALESLASDDRLVSWRSPLLDRLHRQRSVRREAAFSHPTLEQVAEALDNGRPANAADLAALVVGILQRIGRDIRDGADSSWKGCWNLDRYDRPTHPGRENACRRVLLDQLRPRLDLIGIDVQPGGRYADDKRSDIRVAFGGFNVPIEIKRSCHRELWSAIRAQLIARYARDPGADGHGVYLVFWFGDAEGCRPTPRSGPRPSSPGELRRTLLRTLTAAERRKISVCVIDVSHPRG